MATLQIKDAPPVLIHQLKIAAINKGTTLRQHVIDILTEALAKEKGKHDRKN